MTTLVVGTRGSSLALRQAEMVRLALLTACEDLHVTLQIIRTKGDRAQRIALSEMLDVGLFTREIESALLSAEVDLAVHSLKDLPTDLPTGLSLAAFLPREDPADVLVSKEGRSLNDLPRGATVLTGSPRRTSLLLERRGDLRIEPLRGNIETRLRKLEESEAAAAVFAAAGLRRLDLSGRITERLDPAAFVPAPGQGALAVEICEGQPWLAELLTSIDDAPTRAAVTAERALLAGLGGGCRTPIGAWGRCEPADRSLTLTGMLADPTGRRVIRQTASTEWSDDALQAAETLGVRLASEILEDGGAAILKEMEPST